MGNTSNQQKRPDVVKNNEPDSWKIIDNIGYCEIVEHLETEQIAESYIIHLDLRVKLQQEYQKYQYRRTQNSHLVRVYEVAKRDPEFLCSGVEFLNVKTQRILFRLSEIRLFSDAEGVYLLYCCLEGFKKIKQLLQPIKVDENMIGITPNGQIKVWLNENLAKNYPQLEYELNSEVSEQQTQKIMLLRILDIVFAQIVTDSRHLRQIKQIFVDQEIQTFEKALSLCQSIILKTGIDIKCFRINTKNISKHDNKQEEKTNSHLSGRPMDVSNIQQNHANINQISSIEVKQDSFKVEQPPTPKFTAIDSQFLKNSEQENIQSQKQENIIEDKNKPPLNLTQSPLMPTVICYDPFRESLQSLNMTKLISRQSQLQNRFTFPVINQSRSKGKPPRPTSGVKKLPTNDIPNQVIQTVNQIQRSRSKEMSNSQSRKKIGILYTNNQSIQPTESPVRSRQNSASKSQEKKRVVINQRLNQTHHQSRTFQEPFKAQSEYKAKPYTSTTTLQQPKYYSAIGKSFESNQKPFAIQKSFNTQKLPHKYTQKVEFQSQIKSKKYSSAEKNYQPFQNVKSKDSFQYNRSLEKSKSYYSYYTPPSFDINTIKNKLSQFKIKQPSFGLIPQINKRVYPQALPQAYKGILDNKLDLSKYTYNY